jgi:hypothetical protein
LEVAQVEQPQLVKLLQFQEWTLQQSLGLVQARLAELRQHTVGWVQLELGLSETQPLPEPQMLQLPMLLRVQQRTPPPAMRCGPPSLT